VNDLPTNKMDTRNIARGMQPNHFYTVVPFVVQLRNWIYQAQFKRALKKTPPSRPQNGNKK
jgi:hypothetical protein